MEIKTKQRVCSALIKDLEKGKISLTHKLQRKEVWTTRQKSFLIDSILKGYKFYPIFLAEDKETKRLDTIDGVQRLSAIRDYLDGKFRLGRECGPIYVNSYVEQEDGSTIIRKVKYDIAGKRFKKLDPELQETLNEYEMTVLIASDFTDEEIREMFSRLNNGSPLNNVQKNVVDYTYEFKENLDRCLEHEFWTKTGISVSDIRKDKDREVLLQCLYVVSGEEVHGFKNSNIHPFAKRLQETDYKECFNSIYDICDTFNEVFDERVQQFNKMSIAPVFAGANEFMTVDDKGYRIYDIPRLTAYAEKVKKFFTEEYPTSEYADTVKAMGGTAGKENVLYRINYFTEMAKSC